MSLEIKPQKCIALQVKIRLNTGTVIFGLESLKSLKGQENLPLQLHADLSVYFRNGHNRWILYPEGSVYSSGLSL